MAPPRSAFGAPPQGGATGGPAKPDPRWPLDERPGNAQAAGGALLTALRRPRGALAALAALCFGLALLRPGFTLQNRVGSTLLVVDITQSMNVADAAWQGEPVTRLAYTRELLRRTVRELPCGHAAGVGVFTERRTMVLLAPVEVCAHYAALDDVLGRLDWRMAWAADSHLYYGTYSALDEIARHWPGIGLALFTDGHQAPGVVPGREPRYERSDKTPPGVLFAVGGDLPQPVPRLDADGRITGYWTAEEAAAFAPTGGHRTLSVLEMETMKAGGDVRNAPAQRQPGAEPAHLSRRHDDVLQAVAERTGLQAVRATDTAAVVRTLRALPGSGQAPQRHELHDVFVATGALLLLASLLPLRRLDARPPRRPGATAFRHHDTNPGSALR
ncbi:hypothetical protein V4F39_05910 [Aquincola sp. MAHUQ-54]|uniref:MxaL protein n=1 Tax=Aquincola agrisoli TaxID=3119538 RepID=A0AAW9Q387_9BURK